MFCKDSDRKTGLKIVRRGGGGNAAFRLVACVLSILDSDRKGDKVKELRRVKKRGGERGSFSVGRSVG